MKNGSTFHSMALLVIFSLATSLHASTITLVTGDAFGKSSFDGSGLTTGNWSDGSIAPTAGNDYVISINGMRTPSATGNYTFAGDSLTLATNGILTYKGAAGKTITINNFILNGGQFLSAGTAFTLAGNITVLGTNSTLKASSNALYTVTSSISGTGILYYSTESTVADTTGFLITHANNTYSGGTIVNSKAFVDVQADGALGTGNVTVNSTGTLKLEMGVANDYLADSAKLIINASATGIILNYTGIDYLAGISLNGGSTYLTAPGTYGAIGSGANYEYAIFSGTGMLAVIPEPSTVAMVVLGCVALIGATSLRRKQLQKI